MNSRNQNGQHIHADTEKAAMAERSRVAVSGGSGTHAAVVNGHAHHSSVSSHAEKPFRGYTLDEIRYRRLVTGLKIEVAQERLMMLVSPKLREEKEAINGTVNGFQNFMRAVDIAMMAYSITRRVMKIFRRFSRKK